MIQAILVAVILCVAAITGAAQTVTDFSGEWNLDVSKSKLGPQNRIEAMTMKVTQTKSELKVETTTKRAAPSTDGTRGGGRPGGGMGRGPGFGGGDETVSYDLGGKETVVETEGPMGKMPVKYKASIKDGKAGLSSSRTFSGPMGEMSITSKESWVLSADGATLTVEREQSNPRDSTSSTLVFTKKQ